jgi:hypothetical protein
MHSYIEDFATTDSVKIHAIADYVDGSIPDNNLSIYCLVQHFEKKNSFY